MNAHHSFSHEAMKTTFTLRIVCDRPGYAKKVASNCFQELDAIENKLSRYIPGSDVCQINNLKAGERLFLSDTAYACLRIAFDMYLETDGLFDITLGRKIEHRKNQRKGPPPEIIGQLMLDPERPAVHCVEPGREVDLGGIGKGFALDLLKEQLENRGIEAGLLSAGPSTHLAFGHSSWSIQLPDCLEREKLDLHRQAISASGTEIQGNHLIAPDDEARVYPYSRLWVVEDNAARSDAWATACMLLSKKELAGIRKKRLIYTAGTNNAGGIENQDTQATP